MRTTTQSGKSLHLVPALLALVLLGACQPDAGTAPPTTTTPASTAAEATSTTAAPGGEVSGVSLGFNNSEQGVIAPDGTPLLAVMRTASAEVIRGGGTETVRAGGSGRIATAAIAAGETRVVVAWTESAGRANPTIKAAASADSGVTFAPEQVLGAGSGPSLAASGDTILAVWHTGDEGQANGDVVMARLPAGSDTWTSPKAVDDSPAAPLWASVDARASTATVAWRDDRDGGSYSVWTRTSTDLGETWGPEVNAVTTKSGDPDICIDPAGTFWLGYHGSGEIDMARSTDGGVSFRPGVRVGDGWFAHVSCDTGVVAVAWEETTSPSRAPDAVKAAGWATYTPDLEEVARGSVGGPDAAAATIVPAGDNGLELVWVDAGESALTGTLERLPLPR